MLNAIMLVIKLTRVSKKSASSCHNITACKIHEWMQIPEIFFYLEPWVSNIHFSYLDKKLAAVIIQCQQRLIGIIPKDLTCGLDGAEFLNMTLTATELCWGNFLFLEVFYKAYCLSLTILQFCRILYNKVLLDIFKYL